VAPGCEPHSAGAPRELCLPTTAALGCEPHSAKALRELCLSVTTAGTKGSAWEGREAMLGREGRHRWVRVRLELQWKKENDSDGQYSTVAAI
jgi:hypothetical protein